MSLLGFMLVKQEKQKIKDVPTDGLSYHFYDVVIDKYSSQNNIQVLSVLDAIIEQIAKDHPKVKQLMLGSDNASCLASHNNIPYIHHRNLRADSSIFCKNWIYTEACTGKNKLDTHFSYLSQKLKNYVIDNNNIKTELDIYKAMSHEKGMAGTTSVLFDGSKFNNTVFVGNNFKAAKTGVRETHEILWGNTTPWIYTISNITKPEVVTSKKLEKFIPNIVGGEIKQLCASGKQALFISTVPSDINEKKSIKASSTLAVTNALSLSEVEHGSLPDIVIQYKDGDVDLSPGWACYPKQVQTKQLSISSLEKLNTLFERGNKDKAKKVSASRARALVVDDIASTDWYERSILTEAKIKAFFGLTATKQMALIQKIKGQSEDDTDENEMISIEEEFSNLQIDVEDEMAQDLEGDEVIDICSEEDVTLEDEI